MTATEVMILAVLGIVTVGLCVGQAIGAWQSVQLAKHNARKTRDGNITKL